MARRYSNDQRLAPDRNGHDAFAHLVGLRKARIEQVAVQALDLLR